MSESETKKSQIMEMLEEVNLQDEEEVLSYTKIVKHQLAQKFAADALNNGDTKCGNLAAKLLDSLDKAVFTNRKIKVEDKNADTNAALAAQAAEILDSHNLKVTRHSESITDGVYEEVTFDVSAMPTISLKDGIADVGTGEVDISEIVSKGLSRMGSSQEDED